MLSAGFKEILVIGLKMPPKVKTVQNFDYEATRDLLERLNYRVLDFANDLGRPYQTIVHVLMGRRRPMLDLVQAMAKLLHVDTEDLLKQAK